MNKPSRLQQAALAAALSLTLGVAAAQSQSLNLVIAFPAGGPADSLARVVAAQLEKETKQTVIVENKPGGNGAVAANYVNRSRPDGQTLFLSSVGAISINPGLYPKLTYDPVNDFAPVAMLISTPEVLVVGEKHPAKTAREFLDRLKEGKTTLASSGIGSMPHMAIVQLKVSSRQPIMHVPYKGAAPAITDTIGGQVDGFIGDISGLVGNLKAGKLRALATAAPKRSAVVPDTPTFDELGVPNVYANNWYGVLAPKATPKDKVDALNAAFNRVLSSRELKDYEVSTGVELSPMSPEEFARIIRTDTLKWGELIKAENITVDE